MQDMRHVSMGLHITYLLFIVSPEYLLGGFVCVVLGGAVLWSCVGGGLSGVSCGDAVVVLVRVIFPMFM